MGFTYLNPQYSVINYRTAGGFSRYNALVAELRSRNFFDKNLQFAVNWTWSHAIDNGSSTFQRIVQQLQPGMARSAQSQSRHRRRRFRHPPPCGPERRLECPVCQEPRRTRQACARRLELRSDHHGEDRRPVHHLRLHERLLCLQPDDHGESGDRVQGQRPSGRSSRRPNSFYYLDLNGQLAGSGDNAYYNPITYTADFGPYPSNMSGRNIFRRPGHYNVDLGVYKNFSFKERYTLQFRGEFYNLLNHANLYVYGESADISSQPYVPAARGVSASGDRRNIQFALRLMF